MLAAAVFTLLIFASSPSQAGRGHVRYSANIYSGPGLNFSLVHSLRNVDIEIIGCLSDMLWCEVGYGTYSGWIPSEYIYAPYGGNYVQIINHRTFHVPVISYHSYRPVRYVTHKHHYNHGHKHKHHGKKHSDNHRSESRSYYDRWMVKDNKGHGKGDWSNRSSGRQHNSGNRDRAQTFGPSRHR